MPRRGVSGPHLFPGRLLTLRAAVGGLLVALALLAVTQAYAHADRPPATAYAVVTRPVPPGGHLDPAAVELVAAELPAAVAGRAFTSIEVLDGAVSLAPLEPGDLVLLSHVLPADAPALGGSELSFAVPTDRAVAGSVRAGERVDLVASFPTGSARVVAEGALVTGVDAATDGLLADAGTVVLTVRLQARPELLAVVRAVDEGQLTVTRRAGGAAR